MDDNALQLESTTQFRKLFSIERSLPIEEVIQSGVVSRFVEFLRREDFTQLQFEVAWALTNIASGTSKNTRIVIDHGAVPIFVQLLGSPSDDVREQKLSMPMTILFWQMHPSPSVLIPRLFETVGNIVTGDDLQTQATAQKQKGTQPMLLAQKAFDILKEANLELIQDFQAAAARGSRNAGLTANKLFESPSNAESEEPKNKIAGPSYKQGDVKEYGVVTGREDKAPAGLGTGVIFHEHVPELKKKVFHKYGTKAQAIHTPLGQGSCFQMMLQLHDVYDPNKVRGLVTLNAYMCRCAYLATNSFPNSTVHQINIKIKIVSGTPCGAFTMEPKGAQANRVVLDK
ncbi:hypothetical protein IFM89_005823 [Coptis chinensis]|uniref:Uncharacterized protein n=1 Tax=Coptis chinensis TaxID=261450 RepID=A0A835GUX4_9MAGN|nr:hypothetical protein IFM89_005823 [Coptis chinensis]